MSYSRKQMVELANKFVGTTKASANYNKIIRAFNKVSPDGEQLKTDNGWRAATVSALLMMGEFDDTTAPLSMYLDKMIADAKKKGMWKTTSPSIGDLAVYQWPNDTKSVGMIVRKDGDIVEVIVGDVGTIDTCGKVVLDINRDYMIGFITPAYKDAK